jgi:hypothetical protein
LERGNFGVAQSLSFLEGGTFQAWQIEGVMAINVNFDTLALVVELCNDAWHSNHPQKTVKNSADHGLLGNLGVFLRAVHLPDGHRLARIKQQFWIAALHRFKPVKCDAQ